MRREGKNSMKRQLRILLLAVALLLALAASTVPALAAATDEILNFTITVDVNPDASLEMVYHIDWKVLDDSIGELEWIDLGVPNRYHEHITPLSDTIDEIEDNGNALAIYLDRGYGEGETVSIEFSMTQDHMYQIDKWVEGETVYTFTPAWFDGIDVDDLTIRWNDENVGAWQPDCQMESGYLVFRTALDEGERYTMTVVYPNDAFGFSVDRQATSGSDSDDWGEWDGGGESDLGPAGIIYGLIGVVFVIALLAAPFILIFKFIRWITGGTGFGSGASTEKKITRTKIEYYETCPGCGAAREEGKDNCAYCGRSLIKSKEVVEESQIEKPEKYTRNGTYRYGDSPNTYIHVNVVNVPVSRSRSSSHTTRSGGSRSGGSHHSCASSCACASHCACASSCACACACASSGRAGCSVKDFFLKSVHEGRIRVASKRG